MVIKKRKMYKPKQVSRDDMNRGMQNLKQDMQRSRTIPQKQIKTQPQQPLFSPPQSPQFHVPNYWGGEQQQGPKQTTLDDFGLKPKKKPDEPYWTAEQWEEWAYDLVTTFTDEATPRDLLPEWFVTAVDEETE